jgi:hypothetical protein
MRSRGGRSNLMYQEYKDLLSAFQSHGVKYLVVGGFAVVYHSQPRFTKDMDLFIKADLENAKATYAALAEFGVPLDRIRAEDLIDLNSFFRFGREPRGFERTEAPRKERWIIRYGASSFAPRNCHTPGGETMQGEP